jgi:uncharacterized protein (TIGR03437 family)
MKRTAWILAGTLVAAEMAAQQVVPGPGVDPDPSVAEQPEAGGVHLAALPLAFEANSGQAGPGIRFLTRGDGYSLFLTDREAVLALADGAATVTMLTAGGSGGIHAQGEKPLAGKVNYFSGSDPSRWLVDLQTYANVHYPNVYPGIDLCYHGNQQHLEFDFVVAPKADPRQVRLRFSGAGRLRLNEAGDLVVPTRGGTLLFHKPHVYQDLKDERVVVDGRFKIVARNTVTFSLGAYDSKETLIIDPTLSYSTYLGGGTSGGQVGSDRAFGIAVDGSGNTYVAGFVETGGFPITPGAFQTGKFLGKVGSVAFVTKLNSSGTGLVYSTYLGGSGTDVATGVAVDSGGNAYVVGGTSSADFPMTPGSFQTAFSTLGCAFVTKLNPTGTGLVYSTRICPYSLVINGLLLAPRIVVDAAGEALFAGSPLLGGFPVTPGSLLAANQGISVTKLNASGSALVYSAALGGSSLDLVAAIAVDSSGDAYLTGITGSKDFPVTKGAYQSTPSAGFASSTGFVTKLNPAGTALAYSTYFGTSASPNSIAVDAAGNAYITGLGGVPTTPGAFRTNGSGQFVAKLNSAGSGLVYSTFVGAGLGPGFIAVDSPGNAYVTGESGPGLPLTTDAFQKTTNNQSPFFLKLDQAGATLLYSTYLGGNNANDAATGIAVDSSGSAYLTGSASSINFPVTPGALQTTLPDQASSNAFVAKFSFPPSAAPVISAVANAASGLPGLVPNSFAAIYGSNLAPITDSWINSVVNGSLPTSLDGVFVTVAGKPAYVNYISPGQINILAPDVGAGPAPVTITTSAGTSVTFNTTSSIYSPAFFLIPGNQPVATHLDYTLCAKLGTYAGLATVPAKPGETIVLWGTGFGPTTPPAPTGMTVPLQPLYATSALPGVNISQFPARVLSAVLTPSLAGLYQIAVVVPSSLANGDWPIVTTIGGVQSETGIVLTVQQ